MNTRGHECLDDNQVNRLAEGSAPPDEVEGLGRHLRACRPCRQLVAAVIADARGSDVAAAADPLIGIELGRYRLVERIGQGASGLVYRAVDPSLGRSVALKVLRALDPARRAALELERETLARLVHPNVVRVYDTGEVSGDDGLELFVAMELVDGGSLRNRAAVEPIDPESLVEYARQAAAGLAAIHALGLVHRDVKPDNLLVASDGRLLVADLGLSRSAGAEVPLAGTPGYIAPELTGGGAASPASDQYALCLSIAELALGERPQATLELAGRLAGAGLSKRHAAAIARGVAADPADRHGDLAMLAAALSVRPRRRLAWIAAAAALVGIAGVAAAIASSRSPDPCAAERSRFEATFPAERTGRTLAVIAASSNLDAERLGVRLRARLSQLSTMRREACEERSGDPGGRADRLRRTACLEELSLHYDQTLSLLEREPEVAPAAAAIIGELGQASSCAAGAGLDTPAIPPEIREEVVRLRIELSRIKALAMRARLEDAAAGYERIAPAIEKLGHLPLIADLRFARGAVAHSRGRLAEAAEHFLGALETAEAGGHERIRALATAGLLASGRVDPELAPSYIATIEGIVTRAQNDPALRSSLRRKLAAYHGTRGHIAEAYELYRDAATDLGSLPAASPVALAQVELGAAATAAMLERHDEAARRYQAALGQFIDAYGEDHPRVAITRSFLAGLLAEQGRLEEALVLVRQAQTTFERVHGADHPDTLLAHKTECLLLTDLERFDAAEARCAELVNRVRDAKTSGPPSLWSALLALGQLRQARGDRQRALAAFEEALAAVPTTAAPIDRAEVELAVARSLIAAGRQRARARRLLRSAREGSATSPSRLAEIDQLLE